MSTPGSGPRLGLIVGSTRPVRNGAGIARALDRVLERELAVRVEIIDLAEVGLPLLDEPALPSAGHYRHAHTRRWAARVSALDGAVFLTPQYNGGYPAALKNAIDTLYAEWEGLPSLVVSYGFHGGGMAADQLTQVLRRVHTDLVTEPAVRLTFADADLDAEGRLRDPGALVDTASAELRDAGAELLARIRG